MRQWISVREKNKGDCIISIQQFKTPGKCGCQTWWKIVVQLHRGIKVVSRAFYHMHFLIVPVALGCDPEITDLGSCLSF